VIDSSWILLRWYLLHQARELLHDEAPLVGVLVPGQPPLVVDDELDGQGAAHGLLGGGGDGLVEGVGVQALAVVVHGAQGLQRGPGVVELRVLAVKGPSGGLDVILEHLGAGRRTVFLTQGDRPDATGHASDYGIFGIHPVGEEKGEIRSKVVQGHAAGKIVFKIGESVGQRKRQL
jgi:hypothetical protein